MVLDKLKNIAIYGVIFLFIGALIFALFKFALPVILPFAAAFIIAAGIRKGAAYLSEKAGGSKSIWSVAIILLVLAVALLFFWFGAGAVMREIRSSALGIAESLSSENSAFRGIYRFMGDIGERFGDKAKMQSALSQMVQSAISEISSVFAGGAAGFISALPSALFTLTIGSISLFYFTFAYNKTANAIKALLPKAQCDMICSKAGRIVNGLWKFIRAYSFIMLITFTELFIGFLILKIEHAFVYALFISIVDILPVLGVGTVLIPWIIISAITKNTVRAIGLSIIFIIVFTVRGPLEAKVIGKSAGVHPIFALFAIYAGHKIAGIIGMLIAPIALSAVTIIRDEQKNTQNDIF